MDGRQTIRFQLRGPRDRRELAIYLSRKGMAKKLVGVETIDPSLDGEALTKFISDRVSAAEQLYRQSAS